MRNGSRKVCDVSLPSLRIGTHCDLLALPTKPLSSIALSDADARSSLSFVKQKLHDAGLEVQLTAKDAQFVERLGGRASDLESVRLSHFVDKVQC